MSSRGWISLHRRVQDHWLFTERRTFSKFEAWIDLLMMVNHEDKEVILGNELITITRGSGVTSIRKLCSRWGWSNRKVVNFLNLLKTDGMIQRKSDTKKTVITIENYNNYQGKEIQKATRERHESDTRATRKHTNNNDNNYNNENNICARYPEDNQYYQIALYIKQKVMEVNPNIKIPNDDPISMDKWSDDVRKIIELDKRTINDFREIVKFVFGKSDFWNTVIQSPAGLRKNWDKIIPQMNRTLRKNGNVISFKEQMEVLEEWANDE